MELAVFAFVLLGIILTRAPLSWMAGSKVQSRMFVCVCVRLLEARVCGKNQWDVLREIHATME